MTHTPTYIWHVDAVAKANAAFHPPMRTGVDAGTEQEARRLVEARHPKYRVRKISRGRMRLDTYDQLAAWLAEHRVGPDEALEAVQIMVLNGRDRKPWPCPFCEADLNKVGTDNIGKAYHCKSCRKLLQVG